MELIPRKPPYDPSPASGRRRRCLRRSHLAAPLAVLAAFPTTSCGAPDDQSTATALDPAPERLLAEQPCTECTITVDTVLSIPRGEVSDQLLLAVGPDGTVVGLDAVLHPGRVLLFGPDGDIAADADVSNLLTQGIPFFNVEGEILVPDERYGTVQVLTPALEPVRTFMTVDYPRVGIVLANGIVAVNALSSTPGRAGYTLHLVNPRDGGVTSMDRPSTDLPGQGNPHELTRYPAPRDETSFWALHGTTYRIDRWDTSGRLLETLRRDAPWFEKRKMPGLARLTPPPTNLMGLAADADGLLWVLLSVADPEWAGYDLPDGWSAGGDPYPGWNRHLEDGVFDAVLEVVDPEMGAVIARAQYDGYFRGFAGPNVVVHYGGSSNDAGVYTVLRLALNRGGEGKPLTH